MEEEVHGTATEGDGVGEGTPRVRGREGKQGETAGGSGPEGGDEEEIGRFGGRADLIGDPVEGGERVDRAQNLSKGIVVEAAGEGEKREEAGLQGAKGVLVERCLGESFDIAGDGGGEGAGVDEVSGEKKDGLERLASGALGGEKRG